jgi:hypothetical protein
MSILDRVPTDAQLKHISDEEMVDVQVGLFRILQVFDILSLPEKERFFVEEAIYAITDLRRRVNEVPKSGD